MKRDDEVEAKEQRPGDDFDAMDIVGGDDFMGTIGESEIWLEQNQENFLNDINVSAAGIDASLFYNDFPPLPDFPCISSSSSSSSTPTPALTKQIVSSSASSASSSTSPANSWAVLKSDAEQKQDFAQPAAAFSSTADGFDGGVDDVDCMDVMENFGYMDLMDGNDVWDPSSIFDIDDQENLQEDNNEYMFEGRSEVVRGGGGEKSALDELGVMFFEWLKTNKEHISAEDMRNIKLKRATIECASKRLGSTKEGRKQLLKLILEWVEQYQLPKKPDVEADAEALAAASTSQVPCQYQEQYQNPNPNSILTSDPNACFGAPPWMHPPAGYGPDPAPVVAAPPLPVFPGYMGCTGPYPTNCANVVPMNCHPYPPPAPGPLPPPPPPPADYQLLESAPSWPPSQFTVASQYNSFPENGNFTQIAHQPQGFVLFGDQYQCPAVNGTGERLVKLGSSATKEARKKRMARQRRSSVHHHRHQPHQINQHHNESSEQHQRLIAVENNANNAQTVNPGHWVYWPATGGDDTPVSGVTVTPVSSVSMMVQPPPPESPAKQQRQPVDKGSVQPQSNQRPAQSDRRQQQQQPQQQQQQGFKGEKNLKFLLQKVLKQSDVGNLGRIVLPKKEAETQLPELEARDGMPIAMEDIGTSKVWNMRYRFWPNNKSRMYLLENTGEFVKANGLQEGDFIVIYSDVKCGKYLIRGVKVRQPSGPKTEGKKPAKRNSRNVAAGNYGNSSSILNKQ